MVRTTDPKLENIFDNSDDGIICYVPIILNSSTRRNISPGERATLGYLFEMVNSGFLLSGDMLLFDGEAALYTDIVQQFLFENGIHPFVIPSALHQLISPNDNTFHSLLKLRYYRLIADINGPISVVEKLNLAKRSYFDISTETVSSMFVRNGLWNCQGEFRKIVMSLMSEGMECIARNSMHRNCLLKFLQWCRTNNLPDLCPIKLDLSLI